MYKVKEIFPSLIGNERLKNTLSQKLSHAYIIEGAAGSGRLTAVRCSAAAALCKRRNEAEVPIPCGICSVCSRIFRGIHPDVIEYSSGSKKSIGVEAVRSLRSQVFVAPVESEYKFFVIRDADLMTTEAQNALLISLEEPPPFSVFFLIVTDKAQLLETIRSRCVILSTEKLSFDMLSEALRRFPQGDRLFSADKDKFSSIVKSADGSLGEAIKQLEEGTSEASAFFEEANTLVKTVLLGSAGDKVRLASDFPKARDSQDRVFTLAICAVRDIISQKLKTDAPLLFFASSYDMSDFSAVPLKRLMYFSSVLDEARAMLAGNSSPSLTAEQVIMLKK